MSIINLNACKEAIHSQAPFPFALLTHIIPAEIMVELYATIPFKELPLTTRTMGSDKTYHLYNGVLLDHMSGNITPGLAINWIELITELNSSNYKAAMSELINTDLRDCFLQIVLKVYKNGGFISMHTDDEKVAATHLIFINPYFDFNHHGNLYFHNKTGDKIVSIPPNPNVSVCFSRHEHSFHSVDECTANEHPKVSLQIVFWKSKKQRQLSGRNYSYYE